MSVNLAFWLIRSLWYGSSVVRGWPSPELFGLHLQWFYFRPRCPFLYKMYWFIINKNSVELLTVDHENLCQITSKISFCLFVFSVSFKCNYLFCVLCETPAWLWCSWRVLLQHCGCLCGCWSSWQREDRLGACLTPMRLSPLVDSYPGYQPTLGTWENTEKTR